MVEPSLADVRARLTAERERVREQLHQLGADGALDSYDEGFADSGQVTAERGEVEALVGTLLDTLGEIDEALGRADAGTYGRCLECGADIGADRLEAVPTARHCIAHASKRR